MATIENVFCELSNVAFPSSSTMYRVTVKTDLSEEMFSIWMECKKSKRQWECTLEDLTKCSKSTWLVPREVVLCALKDALRSIDGISQQHSSRGQTNLKETKNGLQLQLNVELTPEWSTAYEFELNPIEVDALSIVEARIRDLQEEMSSIGTLKEEIAELKKTMEIKRMSSLSHATLTAPNTLCKSNAYHLAWNSLDEVNELLSISDDKCDIMMKKSGLYLVNISTSNGIDDESMFLQVDGAVVCQEYSNDRGCNVWTTTLELNVNSSISVRYSSSSLSGKITLIFISDKIV